jgi:hypothetical protein
MLERADREKIARVTEHVLVAAERWLVVRRWLIPIPFGEGIRSMPHKETSIRRSGLSSDIQQVIGQRLRAQYAIERSMPARLADLLREFEQRNNDSEVFARAGYASAA